MSSEDHFGRLLPKSPASADLVAAITASAHQHDLSLKAHKAHAERLGGIERALAEIKVWMVRRDQEAKKLAAICGVIAALAGPLVGAVASYVMRPAPVLAAPVPQRSAFDREIEACREIPDDAVRGRCVMGVAAENAR